MSETVKVALRCRPMSEDEQAAGEICVLKVDSSRNELFLYKQQGVDDKQFTYDYTYGFDSLQKEIYDQCSFTLIESVLEGYNATIFAYGQTGTGKTYTMTGVLEHEEKKGIIPRSFDHIFNNIEGTSTSQFLVTCSMLEIYNEDIFDLLKESQNKLELHEKPGEGFQVKDLYTQDTKSPRECFNLLQRGSKNRTQASTQMNKESSRSHCIFTVIVETSTPLENGKSMIRKGKLNLVDLAGSERVGKTGVSGQQLEEAKKINLSLVSLGKVISSLVQSSKHIPYRDSKLTKLLNDSLGGNSKTLMIANVGPAFKNYEETLQTLRYANQAKNIKNKPKINEDPKDAKLRQINEEINKLKEYLRQIMQNKQVPPGFNLNSMFEGELTEGMKNQMLKQLTDDKQLLEDKHREEMEAIIQMRQISEEERKKLLGEVKRHEEEENKERAEKQKLLEQISEARSKVIQGQKTKEEYLQVQRELQKKREENERIRRRQQQMQQEAEDAEIEKCALQQKFENQIEELKEKQELIIKINRRHQQLKNDFDEFIEQYNQQIKQLSEESNELQNFIELNKLTINSYFGPELYQQLDSQLTYNQLVEQFKISEKCPEGMALLFEKFIEMKSIEEQLFEPNQMNGGEEEELLLRGEGVELE